MVDQVCERTRIAAGFTKEAFVTAEVATTAATTVTATIVSATTLAVTTENVLRSAHRKHKQKRPFNLNGSDFKPVDTSSGFEVFVGRSFSLAEQRQLAKRLECTLSPIVSQLHTLPRAQGTTVSTDVFSRDYDPFTHARRARPLTDVG